MRRYVEKGEEQAAFNVTSFATRPPQMRFFAVDKFIPIHVLPAFGIIL